MDLSAIDERGDHRIFGAVVAGDIVDDGAPVDCEVLAMALELWRITGTLSGVAAGLEGWRPGEPWGRWVSAAWLGWQEVRPYVERGKALVVIGEVMAQLRADRARLEAKAWKVHASLLAARAAACRWDQLIGEGRPGWKTSSTR